MVDKNQEVYYSDIGRQRDLFMGGAALLILFFHLWVNSNISSVNLGLLNLIIFFLDIANCGVDLFLLLSGYGIYYSLKRNSIGKFYKKRIVRILPEFVISVLIYVLVNNRITEFPKILIQKDFFINGDLTFWFIPFIGLLYLLAPVLKKCAKGKLSVTLICLGLILINIVLFLIVPAWYNIFSICITRTVIFVIGYGFGMLSDNNAIAFKRSRLIYIFTGWFAIIVAILVYFVSAEYFLLNLMYIPLVVTGTFLIIGILKTDTNLKLIRKIGKISLSMYLSGQVMLPLIFSIKTTLYWKWIIGAIVVIITAVAIHMTSCCIRNLLNKIISKNTKNISCNK